MAELPLVSAVINNHNYARFLGQAIESVLGQTYPAKLVELVVVDDGSTDGSRRVIESFAGRVKPVYQERGGQAAAINVLTPAFRDSIVQRGLARPQGLFCDIGAFEVELSSSFLPARFFDRILRSRSASLAPKPAMAMAMRETSSW